MEQFLNNTKSRDELSRYEIVTKSFRTLLERHFATTKRAGEYAEKLHLSTPYLNECVKKSTGYSVSHHIQHRVVLEAQRLLYHSDRSVKEIAFDLGYEDPIYFSRLFTKVAGMTALDFRKQKRK